MVKQISVFVENKHGRVMEILQVLAEAKVDIKALSLADTSEFGVMRMIVSDAEKAKEAFKDDGVIMKICNVTAVAVEDTPGALMNTFAILCDNGIATEYMYAFAEKLDGESVIAIRCDKPELAEEKLLSGGVHVLTQQEVEKL